jgi:hypothetical protein
LCESAARHVHVLRLWARADPPTAVEAAFNDFVHAVSGEVFGRSIRNPFIDSPSLIDDDDLMAELRPSTEPVLPPGPPPAPPTPPPPTPAAPGEWPFRIVAALVNAPGGAPERETVTIINTSRETRSLDGLFVADKVDRTAALHGTLPAGDAKRVPLLNTGVLLSNSGGEIRLQTGDGGVVHRVTYVRQQVREGMTVVF